MFGKQVLYCSSFSNKVLHKTSLTYYRVEFTGLAAKYNAINLGQGFPNFAAPLFIKKALSEAVMNDPLNQYTRSMGHPRLVNVLASYFSPLYGRELNPMTEVI
jgi:kynurenine--oxoglutarate transaminase/cysteine-S-conjugate beta-lyase/glutamine--phenylpyruvate transaminase